MTTLSAFPLVRLRPAALLAALVVLGCGDDPEPRSDGGAGRSDTGGGGDTGPAVDSGPVGTDTGPVEIDAGPACVPDGMSCAGGETCCGGLFCCSGVPVPPGAEFCGSSCPTSDRDQKQDFEALDPADVLDGVTSLEITRWSYRDAPGVRHVGPMAQDFHRAFSVGESPRNIAPIDGQGVALAAIQELARRQEALSAENDRLRARVERLERAARRRSAGSR